ncbi:hypothetical protein [Xanthobacter tagetidis]|jgi:hypothetical protein|uniref:Uncharacterized protein n=1 Tax=Xanthobacter tagetidis TaxID=60216 RepID=A0A3L7ADR7_9HYPH|nr:hypothetical protein [Xanthobacter tagetidis]RLP78377.1 hypothetical protein D9R14_11245 [Xanthobacter tagetidis]
MADFPSSQGGPASPEVAAYVESLAGELARLARSHNLATLAYLLDMARLEARNIVLSHTPDDGAAERQT